MRDPVMLPMNVRAVGTTVVHLCTWTIARGQCMMLSSLPVSSCWSSSTHGSLRDPDSSATQCFRFGDCTKGHIARGIVKTLLKAHLHPMSFGPRMKIVHHLATKCVVEGTRHVDGRREGHGKEKGGRMEGGERSAHNDTPVLIERTGASSAQTRSSGARREAGIVCMLFQPLSPTIPSPDA